MQDIFHRADPKPGYSRQQQLHPLFLEFANHYGFTPKTHRPYRPRTKGKVERTVDYVKDNFLKCLSLAPLS